MNGTKDKSDQGSPTVAYFSMEIGIEAAMPTYSGGLGVLAGDTIRSAADLGVPLVAVTLLHRKGYFYQRLDSKGQQTEEPVEWPVEDFLEEMPERASLDIEGRTIHIRAWQYTVIGISGYVVPIYFLDVDLPENVDRDKTLTHFLYGGDHRYRFCQEVILGIGGVRMLRALGYQKLQRFHMNEGHASLLTLELLDEQANTAGRNTINSDDVEAVRKLCVFTTHTPVASGHDQFSMELVNQVLGRREIYSMHDVFCCDGVLNMTFLALNLSHYVNGVAKKHGEVSRHMFAKYTIDSITNGVHAATWVSKPLQELYDRHIPDWRRDNYSLRYALSIPKQELWESHMRAKLQLIEYVNRETNNGMDDHVFTIGFARRATPYKRADLVFTDIERLRTIASNVGTFQVIFSGKAHPEDQAGKDIIRRIFEAREALRDQIRIVYLNNYDIELAQLMTAGVDLWLNTPQPPNEASGTSGMKAALNGVPSLSVLDGWWIEGHIEGVTGWSIGESAGDTSPGHDEAKDAGSLYDKLEKIIIPMYLNDRNHYLGMMRHTIALNGSFFNTQRMIQQYVLNAYFR